MENKIVESRVYPLKTLFVEKFDVDFYQREYVWQRKQIEDLVSDFTTEFLKNWKVGDTLRDGKRYDSYFMGEIVVSIKAGERSSIIDGQQRITTLTLFLIYLFRKFGSLPEFPMDLKDLIYGDDYGEKLFNLDIKERKECMVSLFQTGEYIVKKSDSISVQNLVDRYEDFDECWDDRIDKNNIVSFVYWLKEKLVFSKVWTNSDEFAYVIFETMNDRGLSLTQVEMLRSYLLANIDEESRQKNIEIFDDVVKLLVNIKLSSKSKAEFEFFKIFFRGHFAEDFSQAKNSNSDFIRIGKEFHRWVRDNSEKLGLIQSSDFINFIQKIQYFTDVYAKILTLTQERNTREYLYLIVNSDYGFTLQPALILSAICYNDDDETILKKIKIVSKYLTKVLSWRVWRHWMIAQSAMETPIYELCQKMRGLNVEQLELLLDTDPINGPELENAPTLNKQNRPRLKVLLALITEIVASNSNEHDYMLNKKDIEVEHIWADHFERHADEFDNEVEFANTRNGIGDLLLLPKSFNASYGDLPYANKYPHYYGQNILAQSLTETKYQNNPQFIKFIANSNLKFRPYDEFKRSAIVDRAELYRAILAWNWNQK